jgi:hypothetical protein
MKPKSTELNQFVEEMESEEKSNDNNNNPNDGNNNNNNNNNNNGGKFGMCENILRNHHNALKSLFHRNKPDIDAADVSVDSPKPIPQLSPIANSVVSRCSKSRHSSILIHLHSFQFQQLFVYSLFDLCFSGSLECLPMNYNMPSIPNFLSE